MQLFNSMKEYDSLMEVGGDQSKMTEEQKAKDIKKRQNVQKVGIEIEMYLDENIDEAEEEFEDNADKYPSIAHNLTFTEDYSLSKYYGTDITSGITEMGFDTYLRDKMELTSQQILDKYDVGDNCWASYSEYEKKMEIITKGLKRVYELLDNINLPDEFEDTISESLEYIEAIIENVSGYTFIEDSEEIGSEIKNVASELLNNIKDNSEIKAIASTMKEIANDTHVEADKNKALLKYFYDAEEFDIANKFAMDNISDYKEKVIGKLKGEIHIPQESDEKNGIEIVLTDPVGYNAVPNVIDDLVKYCNDVNGEFVDSNGSTGLHIHFGMSPEIEYNYLDIIRLCLNANDEEQSGNIFKYAGREGNENSRNIKQTLIGLDHKIVSVINEEKTHVISKELTRQRYLGVNLTNLTGESGSKNTVEFRWASASICNSTTKFKDYFELLGNMVMKSFTGETILDYSRLEGVTLQLASTRVTTQMDDKVNASQIAVIYNGKLKGYLMLPNYASFTKGNVADKSRDISLGKEELKQKQAMQKFASSLVSQTEGKIQKYSGDKSKMKLTRIKKKLHHLRNELELAKNAHGEASDQYNKAKKELADIIKSTKAMLKKEGEEKAREVAIRREKN